MWQELAPETIRQTSDFTGFQGLRAIVRDIPRCGSFGSGKNGRFCFEIAFRPGEERGRTVFRFRENPKVETRMTRLSAIVPAEMPFEATYSDADGKVATFEIDPRFLANVVRRAGILPARLQRVPPPGFVINQRVDYLCSLLVQETENGAQLGKLYFNETLCLQRSGN